MINIRNLNILYFFLLISFSKCCLAYNNDALFTLSLEDLQKLEVISVAKIKQKASEAPATIRVITNKQIRLRGYQTLDDALKDIPGIDLIGVGGSYPYIHTIRGSFGDENRRLLFMIDGIVENSLNGSFEMAGSAYSLHNIDRIEVIFGPASALYGANAYSGLINLITKQGESYRGVETSVGGGNFHTKMATLYVNKGTEVELGKLDFSLSASWFDTQGEVYRNRHSDFSSGYVDNSYSVVSRLSVQTQQSKTTLGGHLFDMPMGIGTFGNSNNQYFNLPPASHLNSGSGGYLQHTIDGKETSRWHSYFQTLFVQNDYQFTDAFSTFTRIQYRKTGIKNDSFSFSRSGDNFFHFIGQHDSDGYAVTMQGKYDFNAGHSVLGGFQFNHDDLERGYRPLILDPTVSLINGIPIFNNQGTFNDRLSVPVITRGYFLQYIHPTDLFHHTEFTMGVRFDENTLYGSSFTPRFGAVTKWDDELTFKLIYGEAYRAPTPFELFGSSVVRLENPKLKPETVDSYEFSTTVFKNNFQLITTVFYNDLDNTIVEGVPLANSAKFQIQNIGSAKIKGIEIEQVYFFDEKLTLSANVSYQHATQDVGYGNFYIPNIPRLKGNLNIDFQIDQRYQVNIGTNWVGKRTVMPTNPLAHVAGYAVVNLTFTHKEFVLPNLSVQFKANNLFDRSYQDPGIKAADGGQWGTVHEQPGRNMWLLLTYKM